MSVDSNKIDRLLKAMIEAEQEKIADHLKGLDPTEQNTLATDLKGVDFDLLTRLHQMHVAAPDGDEADSGTLEPPEVLSSSDYYQDKTVEAIEAYREGERLLSSGRVAVFLVAGGQGSRLGFDGPKGTLPISPVRRKTLFQLHAEKILALSRRHGVSIPWYIMTSRMNHEATIEFFEKNDYFGLHSGDVRFFRQREIPALDMDGGLILDTRTSVFKNPDGHGGSISALRDSGSLDDMFNRGVEYIFYFQVDNPLVRIADPLFIGFHSLRGAEMSAKAVAKKAPGEKVGVFGVSGGDVKVVEYSDLSDEEMNARNEDGSLIYDAGSIAIHVISVSFLRRMHDEGIRLPYHRAVKNIPSLDGEIEGNKFEMFVFDALPIAGECVILEVVRSDEFSPVKNKSGDSSPETGLAMQVDMFCRWLEKAGVKTPRDSSGKCLAAVEVSPLFALDEDELIRKMHDIEHPAISAGDSLYLE